MKSNETETPSLNTIEKFLLDGNYQAAFEALDTPSLYLRNTDILTIKGFLRKYIFNVGDINCCQA